MDLWSSCIKSTHVFITYVLMWCLLLITLDRLSEACKFFVSLLITTLLHGFLV